MMCGAAAADDDDTDTIPIMYDNDGDDDDVHGGTERQGKKGEKGGREREREREGEPTTELSRPLPMDRVGGSGAAESSVVSHAQMTLLVGAECCCREGRKEGRMEGRKDDGK